MKTSHLLTSILREPWMILPESAEAYLPVVTNWLKGKDVKFEEKGALGFHIAAPTNTAFNLEMGYAANVNPATMEDVPGFPDGSVAVIGLKGELTKYDTMCSYGAMTKAGLIKYLADSKNISGIVIDMDGPGGAVNAIAPLIDAIEYAQGKGKPVVVHGDMVASALLYVAVHADYFMLDNTISSRAGSVGVLIQFSDYSQRLEKEGIKNRTIYAPESTHKNLEFEQAIAGNDEPMKNDVLSPLAKKFMETVKKKREHKLDCNAEGILNGAMFYGGDAVRHGLVDSIGTLNDSIQRTLDLIEVRKYMSFSNY
jgi:protease-4